VHSKVAAKTRVEGSGHRFGTGDAPDACKPGPEFRKSGVIGVVNGVYHCLRNALKHHQNCAKVTHPCDPTIDLPAKFLIIAGALLVLPHARAAEPTSCSTALERIPEESQPAAPDTDSGKITLYVGGIEGQLGDKPKASITGGIYVRQGNKLAGAESAHYDPENKTLFLEGGVKYEDPDTQVASRSGELSYDFGRIRFLGAKFSVASNNAHGAADIIQIDRQGELALQDVSYTTCEEGSNDWLLEARDINLDTIAGVGTARGVKLRFQGVPIFYTPYLSFPVGDARKSGVLSPQIGSTNRSGTEFVLPYYWNLAPNYDLTTTPRYLSDRGLQLQTQFRYLTKQSEGRADVEYLPDDNMFGDTRLMTRLRHRTIFDNEWRNRINFYQVSDDQYFEDLGGSLSSSSTTHLERNLIFDYYTDTLSLFGQLQDYQTIDDAIQPEDRPYRRVPQLLMSANWPDRWLGADLRVNGELVDFQRDTGVTGWRLNMAPEVRLPISRPGWFITPAIAIDLTQYALENTEPGQRGSPGRALPISSLDLGMVLERTMKSGNGHRSQTLEPRVLYVHVPYRDQSDLPVFDTITPDLNLVELFRKNRYLGVDRIADTDQVSLGITSRVIDDSTGRELLTATIGQTRYLSASGVTLPDEPLITNDTSDYVAEVHLQVHDDIKLDFGHQWGDEDRGTQWSQARLQYRPANNEILNFSYRYRRDLVKQGDVSWSWPLASRWNVVGRYNYSFRDNEALEQFFGIEYESCCWGLRLVTRRHLSTRDGTRESSIGLQLILKGMSSVGTAADEMLERGILGYSADVR
jgi:LPS-assembly protein